MNTFREPLWPTIVMTVLLLVALYVASFGPACWAVRHAPSWVDALNVIYRPLLRVA
jgi:uncharacterized protein involved in cysteine biosynthesis